MNYKISDIFAAACTAQRINGQYVKYQVAEGTNTNRSIVIEALSSNTEKITLADREQGAKVLSHFQALTLKILSGKQLNSFERAVSNIVYKETTESLYDISVITPLPSVYEREIAANEIKNRVAFSRGEYLGDVGIKVTNIKGEVLKCSFSHNFNTHFIYCITEQEQPFFFSCKNPIEVGKNIQVSGTIKAHKHKYTQLTRAKVI